MDWLKDTQDNVPSEFEDARAVRQYISDVLKEELGRSFDEVFDEFDETPLGVASIGQVHRARLRGTKQDVAVKIQLPDMERRFRGDIATLRRFCTLATPQFLPSFNEIEKQFCTEFDYRGEAQNLIDVGSVLSSKWSKEVQVPKPHMDLCSTRILVMDYLQGVKMVDGVRAQYKALACEVGDPRSFEEIEAARLQSLREGTIVLKSLDEAQKEHQQIKWMLFINNWLLTLNVLRAGYNYTLSPLSSLLFGGDRSQWDWKYYESPTMSVTQGESKIPLVDLGHALEILCQVHANQLFEGGAFNADPHPGNILLLENGKLGLIDYGQVCLWVHHSLCGLLLLLVLYGAMLFVE
jgi:aarF domain-containing kinase